MRLLKFMAILAVITSMGLVGCNKDKNDVEVVATPTLKMGTYTSQEYESSNCADKNDEGVGVADCDTENGCTKITINADKSVVMGAYDEGELFFELEGVYTIDGNSITVDFTSLGITELFVGEITTDNNFYLDYYDEDTGCTESSTFTE